MPDGSIVLVEMFGQRLTRVRPDGSKDTIAEIPGGPNGAAVGPDGAFYVCNNGGSFKLVDLGGLMLPGGFNREGYTRGSIQRVDPHDGTVTDLYTECDGHALRSPNDLVMDGHGGFWFTDHGIRDATGRTADLTGIYYAHADGSGITEVVFPTDSPNGIGLSPDTDTSVLGRDAHRAGALPDDHVAGRGAAPGAARHVGRAVRIAGLSAARFARCRRRGLGVRGDDRQRGHHGDLA